MDAVSHKPTPPFRLRALEADHLPALLGGDNLSDALSAFTAICHRPVQRRYKTGLLGISDDHLITLAKQAQSDEAKSDPLGFFTSQFSAFEVLTANGQPAGHLTGFYEPEVDASRCQTDEFTTPLLARPDDLVDIDSCETSHSLPPSMRFARRTSQGSYVPFYDRQDIESGALSGRGLELVWLRDRVEAFFIHIQGAACLRLTDGTKMRVTYSAKSGHAFTAIGRLLVQSGEIDPTTVSMQTIKAWLYANVDRAQAMMWRNQSYIFFRQTPFQSDHKGPIAAAKIPLVPKRSIAVDRTIHTFGTPIFISVPDINGEPWHRLMFAHDTGSAIVGAARADLFFGTGDHAGTLAGGVNATGDFVVLVPNASRDTIVSNYGELTR